MSDFLRDNNNGTKENFPDRRAAWEEAAPVPGGDAAARLGTESVGKLLLRFSIPAISGMLVSALYNVVDRVFVGRGVNELALAGLSLVLPLMTISMAFAMLFGVGAANLISMRLGQGKRKEAENALNHCFWLLAIVGVLLMLAELVFLDFVLSLLGAQEGSIALGYARRYYRIILYGHVFMMVGFGFSHCARAQGFPIISMVGMFIGAGMNMILDPLFIFVFGWEVEGAAIATIISQFCSAVWVLSFSSGKKAVIRLRFRDFKPSIRMVLQIMAFGSAQFLLQFVMSGVQLLYNTSMGWYGTEGLGVSNGGDIALSGLNIAGSILMLILMPIFGINQGAQPILGYNYGAKKFDRVLKAYLGAVGAATIICTVGFVIVQGFPHFLVSIFAPDGSDALLQFTPTAIRIQMLMLPLAGFQIVSSNVFVVTGRPKISIFLSMLRQCIALIPCMVIFGRIWGLYGVVASAPVADGFSSILTGILILFELKKLRAAN
ncbi:MAG: MATE family efflux transporter [Spirochaetaceae bacterium]|jgi:putative MATE family efflux protein|nr:MATE family efflux transporter [Spirochaetaceae bacterium]